MRPIIAFLKVVSAIDIYRPQAAVELIRDVISSDLYHTSIDRLALARENVLWKHNLFAALTDYWSANLSEQSAVKISLLPKSHRTGLILRQFQRNFVGSPSRRHAA